MKPIRNKEFVAIALDLKHKAFVVYIAALNIDSSDWVHPSRKAQIAHLKADEAPTEILSEYADFVDVFSPKLAIELPEYTEINNQAIKLVDDWQLPYGPINSLSTVELETLKAYIKNNLANSFIKPSSPQPEHLFFLTKSQTAA